MSRTMLEENASIVARRPRRPPTLRAEEHRPEMRAKQITTSQDQKAVPTTKAIWFMLVEIAMVPAAKVTPTQPILTAQPVRSGDCLEWKSSRSRNELKERTQFLRRIPSTNDFDQGSVCIAVN